MITSINMSSPKIYKRKSNLVTEAVTSYSIITKRNRIGQSENFLLHLRRHCLAIAEACLLNPMFIQECEHLGCLGEYLRRIRPKSIALLEHMQAKILFPGEE